MTENVRIFIDHVVKSTTSETTGAELHRLAGHPDSLKDASGKEVPNNPKQRITLESNQEFTSHHKPKPDKPEKPEVPEHEKPKHAAPKYHDEEPDPASGDDPNVIKSSALPGSLLSGGKKK